jgi:hypothetical protein
VLEKGQRTNIASEKFEKKQPTQFLLNSESDRLFHNHKVKEF